MSTSSERRILLGMPGYGKQTAAAGRGFWRACTDMSCVNNGYENGSLLACNFNQLWCAGLNEVHLGGRLDYWAMLHDDVGPQDFWLDKLIEELEDRKLDVLAAVVPIKDTRGMTSMALANGYVDFERSVWTDGTNDGRILDHFMPKTRLSMHDVYELPETFTSDDLGKPLLLNTGCWVVKWNQELCRQLYFTINDRIVFNRKANRYQAQTEPEDWFFSRLCHELGMKIGATRKIALNHRGEIDFTNIRPWGSNVFDSETVELSPVPNAFPHEIPGWLTPAEGKALAELARGKRVLEIGSFCGRSTVCIGRTAASVTAVDYFDGRATTITQDTRKAFDGNITRYGIAEKVTVHHPDEPLIGEYEFAFIDGAHDADSVRADIEKARAVLTPDGLIAFHDYNAIDPGVTEAVNEFLADGATLISTHDTLAVVKPMAEITLEV